MIMAHCIWKRLAFLAIFSIVFMVDVLAGTTGDDSMAKEFGSSPELSHSITSKAANSGHHIGTSNPPQSRSTNFKQHIEKTRAASSGPRRSHHREQERMHPYHQHVERLRATWEEEKSVESRKYAQEMQRLNEAREKEHWDWTKKPTPKGTDVLSIESAVNTMQISGESEKSPKPTDHDMISK
jgi:hypothetical protein